VELYHHSSIRLQVVVLSGSTGTITNDAEKANKSNEVDGDAMESDECNKKITRWKKRDRTCLFSQWYSSDPSDSGNVGREGRMNPPGYKISWWKKRMKRDSFRSELKREETIERNRSEWGGGGEIRISLSRMKMKLKTEVYRGIVILEM
jgi:hypothetical protein